MTVTAILVVNNLRDIETDRRAGKRTLAVLLGAGATRAQYALLTLGAYVAVPFLLLTEASAWVLLPWLSLPFALLLNRVVLRGESGRGLNSILQGTGQLHLRFGVLLAIGLLL